MKTKRIFALLLSLLMALTMGLTTFAAGEGPNGTIKINGVLEGNTYTVYKIFVWMATPQLTKLQEQMHPIRILSARRSRMLMGQPHPTLFYDYIVR